MNGRRNRTRNARGHGKRSSRMSNKNNTRKFTGSTLSFNTKRMRQKELLKKISKQTMK